MQARPTLAGQEILWSYLFHSNTENPGSILSYGTTSIIRFPVNVIHGAFQIMFGRGSYQLF